MIELTINGKPVVCESGETILQVAQRNRIQIPTLCHHEGLCAQGVCRVCMVEIIENGWSKLVAACIFPIRRSIEVFTDNEAVHKHRNAVISLLLARTPGNERIERLARYYKIKAPERLEAQADEKCVLCGLCVRACSSLGTGAISTINRGISKKVSTPYDEPSKTCIGCASCASVCPTGAITVEETSSSRKIWGKDFEFVRCACCGEAFATKEQLEYAANMAGLLEPNALCERCRKQGIAAGMKETFAG